MSRTRGRRAKWNPDAIPVKCAACGNRIVPLTLDTLAGAVRYSSKTSATPTTDVTATPWGAGLGTDAQPIAAWVLARMASDPAAVEEFDAWALAAGTRVYDCGRCGTPRPVGAEHLAQEYQRALQDGQPIYV
jgi:hypothetical protein